MNELIDLSEISYDHLLRLYCQLKLLDETGKLTNCETLGRSFDTLENDIKVRIKQNVYVFCSTLMLIFLFNFLIQFKP